MVHLNKSSKLSLYENVKTLTSREVQTAVRLVVAGELAKHAASEDTKATTEYPSHSSWNNSNKSATMYN